MRALRDDLYARPAGASTPMGYGVAACATGQGAAATDRASRARTWTELVRELRAEAPRPKHLRD